MDNLLFTHPFPNPFNRHAEYCQGLGALLKALVPIAHFILLTIAQARHGSPFEETSLTSMDKGKALCIRAQIHMASLTWPLYYRTLCQSLCLLNIFNLKHSVIRT